MIKEIILAKIPEYLKILFDLENCHIVHHKNSYVNLDEEIEIDIDILTHPIMYGLDQYERPYICLKLYNDDTRQEEVHILFQRMSNSEVPWVVNETCFLFGKTIINKNFELENSYVKYLLEQTAFRLHDEKK